ncbi:hypothetical protein VTH82DRAFT_7250 [Thermothelomyces myriococcoides]
MDFRSETFKLTASIPPNTLHPTPNRQDRQAPQPAALKAKALNCLLMSWHGKGVHPKMRNPFSPAPIKGEGDPLIAPVTNATLTCFSLMTSPLRKPYGNLVALQAR